jgi:hypothetical protein
MSVEEIVKGLRLKEEKAEELWRVLIKHFGDEFFL